MAVPAAVLGACIVQVPDKDPLCGDALKHDREECDDGNPDDLDGCHECRVTEFRVSADESGDLAGGARVAFSPGFGFHVLFSSLASDEVSFGVRGRRYDASGLVLGDVATLDTSDAGAQQVHGVAAVPASGHFAAVWTDYFALPDTTRSRVMLNLFTGTMSAPSEVTVTGTEEEWSFPSVTVFDTCSGGCLGEPRIVVSWVGPDGDGRGLHARCYDWELNPVGDAFPVNTFTTGLQARAWSSNIASTTGGDFVIGWRSNHVDGVTFGVFARRFDGTCSPIDVTEFQVNEGFDATNAVLAMNEGGEIVFAYSCPPEVDGNTQWDMCARRFSFSSAEALTPEFHVHPPDGADVADMAPSVDVNASGAFVVAWERWTNGEDYEAATAGAGLGISAVLFPPGASTHSEGTALTTFFREDENPSTASVALADDGRFVIAWGSGATFEDDVYAQKYDASGQPLGSNPW